MLRKIHEDRRHKIDAGEGRYIVEEDRDGRGIGYRSVVRNQCLRGQGSFIEEGGEYEGRRCTKFSRLLGKCDRLGGRLCPCSRDQAFTAVIE